MAFGVIAALTAAWLPKLAARRRPVSRVRLVSAGGRGIWHAGGIVVSGIRVGFRQILVILQPLQGAMREIAPARGGGASGFLRGGLVLGHGRFQGVRGRAALQGAGGMI